MGLEIGGEPLEIGSLDHTVRIQKQDEFGLLGQTLPPRVIARAEADVGLFEDLDIRQFQAAHDRHRVIRRGVVDDHDTRHLARRQGTQGFADLSPRRVGHDHHANACEAGIDHMASLSESLRSSARADVIVLVGTSWARLQHHNTRWRAVLQRWADDGRIERLRVVDYPSLSPRHVSRRLAFPIDSWDPRIEAVGGRVPVWRKRRTPLDRFAWRAAGAAINRALPPTGGRRVVIAATPMWAPVLRHIAADGRGFDAVDDWRALPAVATVADHAVAGYRAAAAVDSASAVSSELAETLRRDFGIAAHPIGNGVDLDAYTGPVGTPPSGLPPEPFAVYLGVVQERVDLDLIAAACAVMRVVVAGPAAPEFADALRRTDVTWLGPVEPETIPDLLRAAAVGLVPHRVDALTTSMDPMKVFEYLAAGLPVVVTPVRISARSDRILVASGAAAFAEAVRAARDLAPLGHPDPAVDGFSWRSVADRLFDAHIG